MPANAEAQMKNSVMARSRTASAERLKRPGLILVGARLCRPDQPQQFEISGGLIAIHALRLVLRTQPRSVAKGLLD